MGERLKSCGVGIEARISVFVEWLASLIMVAYGAGKERI
jgi:hypothetical protein